MALRKTPLVNGQIYHIFNRGVEKRKIFGDTSDYFRFIFALYECNDKNPVVMRDRLEERKKRKQQKKTKSIGSTYGNIQGGVSSKKKRREILVDILSFCLMSNHFHLILRQSKNDGIPFFMRKLGNSYIGYFNEKYNRKGMGSLFQGRFKSVHVKTNDQFKNLVSYVFTNPIEILEKKWKEKRIKNLKKSIKFLESYRWSNYLDCIGESNFPSVTKREFLLKVFGGSYNVKKFVKAWILYRSRLNNELEKIKDLTLD